MSEIPQISLAKLTEMLNNGEVLPSVEIIGAWGEYRFTVIAAPREGGATIFDEIRTQAEYLGVRSNTVLPPRVIEALTEPMVNSLVCPVCQYQAKNEMGLYSHQRKHKVRKENVYVSAV